jgi:FtsP/CotA-like multicopper oxidase with cupredoxin domain
LALIEKAGVGFDAAGSQVEGPIEALLGMVTDDGHTNGRLWADKVTENPGVGDTEVWEIYNTTADAHPIHIHELTFEVVNRQDLLLDGDEVIQPYNSTATKCGRSRGRPVSKTP